MEIGFCAGAAPFAATKDEGVAGSGFIGTSCADETLLSSAIRSSLPLDCRCKVPLDRAAAGV